MSEIKRKGDRLSDEKRNASIQEFIDFYQSERDETIGRIAAEHLLNFFLETVGPEIYNRGIMDAKGALENRMDELKYDFDELLDV